MSKIIVIGSSNTDLAIKTDSIPEPGETVIGGKFMMTAGGKGANQAVAAARLGGDVAFVTKVGDDMFGDESRARYVKEGLPEKFLLVEKGTPSGMALITVDAKGENCIVVAPGANNTLSPADVDAVRGEIEAAEYLLMQLEVPMETVEHAAEIAAASGTKVILTPAPAAKLSEKLIANLYLVTPNRTECQLLSGLRIDSDEDARRAAARLMEMGARNVIIMARRLRIEGNRLARLAGLHGRRMHPRRGLPRRSGRYHGRRRRIQRSALRGALRGPHAGRGGPLCKPRVGHLRNAHGGAVVDSLPCGTRTLTPHQRRT